MPYVSISLKQGNGDSIIAGTISAEDGRFTIPGINQGNFILQISYTGFQSRSITVTVGQLNDFLDLGIIMLIPDERLLDSITVRAIQDGVSPKMDKKTFTCPTT